MSLSRGADPLLVFVPGDDGEPLLRTAPSGSKERHDHLLSVAASAGGVMAVGPGDAPMTHSAELDKTQGALGSVEVRLR